MAEETILRRDPRRDDERFAMIAMMVTCAAGGKAKLQDFMPGERREQTDEEIREMCELLNAVNGGEVR